MKVEYITHMGDDLLVANIARVSFAKESKEFTTREQKPKGSDEGIIEYLAKHNHWCYDDLTEVFTPEGWVKFCDIEDHLVAQVTGWESEEFRFDFVKPDAIHKTYYEGEMYCVESSTIDYCVTPHHKMLYKSRKSSGFGEWKVGNSDVLFGKEKLLQTKCKINIPSIPCKNGQIHGFLLGDGFCSKTGEVKIRLKRDGKIKYLKNLLTSTEIPFSESVKGGVTEFQFQWPHPLYLNQEKGNSLDYLNSQGIDFCHGVLKGLLESDGSKKRNTYTFSNSSKKLIEIFSYLSTMFGENPILNSPRHLDNPKHRKNERVMLQTRDHAVVNRKGSTRKEFIKSYKGLVSCVTVPSGMLLVRRNGKQLVCGNTPFGHPTITLRVRAPVPIRTQCFKSKIGFVENEESRRYISTEPELFVPEFFRSKPDGNKKQGSGGVHPFSEYWKGWYTETSKECIDIYNDMIAEGVAPEQARFILPQGVYVNWIWTGSLQAYSRFCGLRLDTHAQEEVREIAEQVSKIIEPLFPYSWKALTCNGV